MLKRYSLLMGVLLIIPVPARAWVTSITGDASRSLDTAARAAIDSEGNPVVVGKTENRGPVGDFTVIKFDGETGTELWRRNTSGTQLGRGNEALAVAIDAQDHVLVAGSLLHTDTGPDFAVIKYTSQGEEQWRRVVNGTANREDAALAIAVDSQGHVLAAGYLTNAGTGQDFTVIKYTPDGEEEWRGVVDGAARANDTAWAIAVDAQDAVLAVGSLADTTVSGNFAVIKYTGSGEEQWRRVVSGTDRRGDRATAVAIDSQDAVLVVGYVASVGSGRDFTTIKYTSQGDEQWRRAVNGAIDLKKNILAIAQFILLWRLGGHRGKRRECSLVSLCPPCLYGDNIPSDLRLCQ